MHRTIILELDIQRIVAVCLRKQLPCRDGLIGFRAPIRRCKFLKESIFVIGEVFKREFSGGFVHEARIVAEIPALHHMLHTPAFHFTILAIQDARNGNVRNRRDFMGTAHLYFRRQLRMIFARLCHAAVTVRRTDGG